MLKCVVSHSCKERHRFLRHRNFGARNQFRGWPDLNARTGADARCALRARAAVSAQLQRATSEGMPVRPFPLELAYGPLPLQNKRVRTPSHAYLQRKLRNNLDQMIQPPQSPIARRWLSKTLDCPNLA